MSNLLGGMDINFLISVVAKLVTILILSSIIGLERESYNKPAGFRTHILVGVSAVLVVICGVKLFDDTGADPSKIPAQLLSGIGFLGAGTILRNGYSVKGLTTAASLLATTCIGLTVGMGLYLIGVLATIIVFIVLECTSAIGDKFERRSNMKIKINLNNPKKNLKEITRILEIYVFEVSELKIESDNLVSVSGTLKEEFNKNKIFYELLEMEDVDDVFEDVEKEKKNENSK